MERPTWSESTLPPRPYDWMSHGPGDYESLNKWKRTYNRIKKADQPKATPPATTHCRSGQFRMLFLSSVLFVMGVIACFKLAL
jgi:hypothetical protein